MFGVCKSWRWNRFNLSDARVDVFVAHGEVVRRTSAFKFLVAKRFELVHIVGADAWVVLANDFVARCLFRGRFVACNVILGVLDLTRIWCLVVAWTRGKSIGFVKALRFHSKGLFFSRLCLFPSGNSDSFNDVVVQIVARSGQVVTWLRSDSSVSWWRFEGC